MDQTFDWLQKLISQLEIQGEVINQEDMNLKLLRSLPSEWKTHALIWRNKVVIETNQFGILGPLFGTNNLNTNSYSSTNEADNTAYGVSTAHTQSSPTSGDNLKEMDLQWEMAMLTIRARRFIRGYGQNALIAQDRIVRIKWSYQAEEEHPTNYALMAFTIFRDVLLVQFCGVDSCSKTCVKAYATLKEQYDSLSSDYKKSQFNLVFYKAATTTSPTVESFVNLSDKTGSDKGYHSVPPPLTWNFIPRKPDLTFIDEIVESENMDVTTVVTPSNDKTVENKGVSNTVESNAVRMNNSSAPIIEDWNSDDEILEDSHYVCDKKVVRPVWNNSRRVNHKNFSNKMTHPHPKRSFVPQAVLTRTCKINTAGANVNTAGANINTVIRPINIAASTPIVNHPRPKSNAFKRGYSQSNPQQKEYKEKLVIDSGCFRHMTGNKCYLDEYEDYDGGFVSFSDGKGRIYRKSVDLKSVVPTGGLTCLIAKATIDESNTWHRRLGHINFKTMNKLVKGNLVKGLPSKIFENDHSCVACQKGKQHKGLL
ncbi:putative ribonuclease H-like domain-containing protein [Tanacetum coccineum]